MTTAVVRLPTDKLALLIAGLATEGPPRQPDEERDGWLFYRFSGLAGGVGQVGIRSDDHEAISALERASTELRAYVELFALLARLLELDDKVGEWRLERTAELLYGKRRASSHRERQLPGLHGWMALFERGWWQLDATVENQTRPRPKKDRSPSYGGSTSGGPLVTVERMSRSSATVHLAPALAGLKARSYVEVPSSTFRLPQEGHHNPEGNRPSLAIRARARVAAAITGRWRQRLNQPVAVAEILSRFGGLDLGKVTRRRRAASWFDDLTADLTLARTAGGVGLERRPIPRRPVLGTLVRLILAPPPAGPGAPLARAPAPS